MNKNRFIVICIRLVIAFLFVAGVSMCVFAYPFQVSLTAIGVVSGERVPITLAQYIEYWSQLSFYWLVSVPVFILLLVMWRISTDIKNGKTFSQSVSRKLKICSMTMFFDSLFYLAGQIAFTFLGWNPFAVILFPVGAMGLAISFAFFACFRYTVAACGYKKETEEYV